MFVELEVHVIRPHTLCKGSKAFMVTFINLTTIFEWCVVKSGYKNINQKDMCSKEIGVHVQNMFSILNSIISMIVGGGDLYDHSIFALVMNKTFI